MDTTVTAVSDRLLESPQALSVCLAGKAPVYWVSSHGDQCRICLGKWLGPEEPIADRKWTGMGGLDDEGIAKQGFKTLSLPPPQYRDQREWSAILVLPPIQCCYRGFGYLLPALVAVAGRLADAHRQASVEQHHATSGPGGQIAVQRLCDMNVRYQLSVDVAKTSWKRADPGVDAEAQADGMPWCRIGILADDEHAYRLEGNGERSEDVSARRQVWSAFPQFVSKEVSHPVNVWLDGFESLRPARFDELVQRFDVWSR